MFWSQYPNTNFHELNLDWILAEIKKLEYTMDTFVSVSTIKYADPILWDITAQYEQNTVVIDPQTGDAYLSVSPVPVGVSLSNTTYWTPIFNYQAALDDLENRLQPQITQNADDIDNLESEDVGIKNRLDTAEDDITALDGRVTDNADDITALDGRVTTLETSVTGMKWYVTPEDFGADGGADDSAAVQAAFDDGRPVYFTQNYHIKNSVTIPFDVSRVVTIDFDQYWLIYDGDGTDTAAVIMRGHNCILKNIKINNSTSHSLIGMYWTSASNVEFSAMNTIYGCQIYNFKTGILYGDINGVVDAPQSENVLIGFKTRGVELCFYSLMNNAIINIIGSVLMSGANESTYSYDTNRAACVRNDAGLVLISDSTLDKVDNTSGFGIFGANIQITDSIMECASPIAFCAGDITMQNIKGGYYSQYTVSPFVVDPSATGVLRLSNVSNVVPATTDAKFVSAASGYNGTGSYKVILTNMKLNDRAWSVYSPAFDYPVILTDNVINGEIVDLNNIEYNAYNSDMFTVVQATLTTSGSDITLTSSGAYPSVSTPEFNLGGKQAYCFINIESMTGTFSLGMTLTDSDGASVTQITTLHAGMNCIVSPAGYKKATMFAVGSAVTDVLVFDKVYINAMS